MQYWLLITANIWGKGKNDMKKMFFITLCVLLMLSVAVVSAQEVITEDAPQFSRENMTQRGQFNPENIPQGERRFPDGMQPPGGGMQWEEQQQELEEPMTFFRFITTYSTPIISVVLLGLAFIFVIFYKRKNY